MSKLTKALTAAAGNAGGESLYVEDVFSTYLWTGDGTTDRPIQNGIDLDGEGGLVWIKERDQAGQHMLTDTERGLNSVLRSHSTAAELVSPVLTSFDSDGFSLTNNSNVNQDTQPTCSWTFRKAEKFFDVVTYTGDGVAGRTVAHNLGSTPAFIIVKQTDGSNGWPIYHASYGATYVQFLNDSTSAFTNTGYWNDTAPTDAVFSVGTNSRVNASGSSYVAYVFASDAGGYGDDGSENIIKCGSFTTDGSKVASVNCGFEPQWLLVKKRTTSSDWFLFDAMRGMPVGANPNILYPNQTNAENTGQATYVSPTAIGFDVSGVDWEASAEYIYIAIRRPMKTPESGTEVFAIDDGSRVSDGKAPRYRSGFVTDFYLWKEKNTSTDWTATSRLQGQGRLVTNSTTAENSSSSLYKWDFMNGALDVSSTDPNKPAWMFKRATGFFDVVAWQVDGTGDTTINHNLGVVPEMIITKNRNSTSPTYNWWVVAHKDLTGWDSANENDRHVLRLNTSAASGQQGYHRNITASTMRLISVASGGYTTTDSVVAYLFATLAGVSKVGSYTGTGSNVDVDCGFSAGARFILIKRTDSTGDWYVWDSERGIVAGNDPYLLLNSTAAEVTSTDYIDPLSSGFTVTSSAPAALNASGGSYIFLAIA